DGGLDRAEFAGHAADGEGAFFVPDEGEGGLDVVDFGDDVVGGAGFGAHQAGDAGEEDQQLRPDEAGDDGGKGIVVADLEFVDGDRIVFVEDGNDVAMREDRVQGGEDVAAAAGVLEIVVGDEELGDLDPVEAELAFVEVHQPGLSG